MTLIQPCCNLPMTLRWIWDNFEWLCNYFRKLQSSSPVVLIVASIGLKYSFDFVFHNPWKFGEKKKSKLTKLINICWKWQLLQTVKVHGFNKSWKTLSNLIFFNKLSEIDPREKHINRQDGHAWQFCTISIKNDNPLYISFEMSRTCAAKSLLIK